MHSIEETEFGYRMTFDGFLTREEMEEWVQELDKKVSDRGSFGVLVDMRGAAAMPADALDVNFRGIQMCRERGMDRTAVVVANPITKIQATRVAKESEIDQMVQFVDASKDPDWEKSALDWIRRAVPVAV